MNYGSVWDIRQNDNFILMQFTGLKDKNGKEIYEGDFLKCHRPNEKLTFIAKVEYKDARFVIQDLKQEDLYWDFNVWTVLAIEIIGNIYENPELIQ